MAEANASNVDPKIAGILKEADQAYQTFLARMRELERERLSVYAKAVGTIDHQKIESIRSQLLS